MSGVSIGPREMVLTERAMQYLAEGPAEPPALIAHVCQLPAVPGKVAEHMASALFAEDARFTCGPDGRWSLCGPRSSGATGGAALSASGSRSALAQVSAGSDSPDSLDSLTYSVVDVETTGIRADGGDRVTEIAVVRVKDGVPTTVFDMLINPERPIPPYVSSLTSITWDMVCYQPPFRDVCAQLLGVLEGSVFVAHNANFDWRFISMEVMRATGRPLQGRRLCTVRLARKLLPQLRRRSLDFVANHYGIEIEARHRAGGDAVATAHMLVRMLRDLRGRGCGNWDDLDELLHGSARARRNRRASALPHPVTRDTTA